MRFGEVQGIYGRLAKEVPSIVSTFRRDSYDDSSKVYLVSSEEPSYNFDRVKNHFDRNRRSADSLYLSSKTSSVHFIEFKNAKFHNFSDSIPTKALDSAFIHRLACENPESLEMEHTFTVVMSTEKNAEMENPTSVMMRISGYFDDKLNQEELSNELQEAYNCLCLSEERPFAFTRFEVILSSRFEQYLANA